MATSRSRGVSSLTTRSPTTIRPPVACSSPAIMRSTVVLPHPDGPTRTISLPSGMTRLMSFTATVPSGKVFATSSSTICDIAAYPFQLSLEPERGDPADEPLLNRQEHDRWRDHREQVGGQQEVRLRVRAVLEHVRQADSDRELVVVIQVEQRAAKVVPVPDDRENRAHRQDWYRQRQDDAPVDLEVAHAIDPRRLVELLRNGAHVLPDEEDEESIAAE